MRSNLQILSASEAVALVPSGATVAVSGFVGAGHPEAQTAELANHFLKENKPENLTLV